MANRQSFLGGGLPPWNSSTTEELLSRSTPISFSVGTGLALFTRTILPIIEATEQEVILVTCFWARSKTLDRLGLSLIRLSDKALERNDGTKIRVRICFSTMSLAQSILKPTPGNGQVYAQTEWSSVLGLPPPDQLAGLDLVVTRKFFRPLGIIHSKFIITDRLIAVMPSCNVSWEAWLEAAIVIRGPVVQALMTFYTNFWESRPPPLAPLDSSISGVSTANTVRPSLSGAPVPLLVGETMTVLLPSPRTPACIPPFLKLKSAASSYSPTPLNNFLLSLFSSARKSINILTPNLTSPAVLAALQNALARGVDVTIATNAHLMTLEQLVTAGTTTPCYVKRLIRFHGKLLETHRAAAAKHIEIQEMANSAALANTPSSASNRLLDSPVVFDGAVPGQLTVIYFEPEMLDDLAGARGLEAGQIEEPAKAHVKCTAVDGYVVVLGSGNMDAASWYASQELGIALYGTEIVRRVWIETISWMRDRQRTVYNRKPEEHRV